MQPLKLAKKGCCILVRPNSEKANAPIIGAGEDAATVFLTSARHDERGADMISIGRMIRAYSDVFQDLVRSKYLLGRSIALCLSILSVLVIFDLANDQS